MTKRKKNNSTSGSANGIYNPSACNHIKSAIESNKVNKTLKQKLFNCEDCEREKKNHRDNNQNETTGAAANTGNEESNDDDNVLWICLKCFRISCGRNSTNQHALKHFHTPRSESHCLAFSPSNSLLWCYSCDDEVNPEQTTSLNKLVASVMKWYEGLTSPPDAIQKRFNGDSNNVSSNKSPRDLLNFYKQNPAFSPKKLVMHGLVNLGNTCYFNSVVQCLVRTPAIALKLSECFSTERSLHLRVPEMKSEHDSDDESEAISEEIDYCTLHLDLSDSTPTSSAFLQVYNKVMDFSGEEESSQSNNAKLQKGTPVNPQNLRQCLGRVNHRFNSYAQQDSHELLRSLLDTIKQEEVRYFQKAVLTKFNLKKSTNPKEVPDNVKQIVRHYGQYVQNSSGVDHLFGGCLLSSVTCETCHLPSLKFEHFLDLSLAIENKNRQQNFNSISQDNNHCGFRKKKSVPDDDAIGAEAVPSNQNTNELSKHKAKKAKEQAKKEKRRNKGKNEKKSDKINEGDVHENNCKAESVSSTCIGNNPHGENIDSANPLKLKGCLKLFRSNSLKDIREKFPFNKAMVDPGDSLTIAKRSSSMSVLYCDITVNLDDSTSSQFETVSGFSVDKDILATPTTNNLNSALDCSETKSVAAKEYNNSSILSPESNDNSITVTKEEAVDEKIEALPVDFFHLSLNGSDKPIDYHLSNSPELSELVETEQIVAPENNNMNGQNGLSNHKDDDDDSKIHFETEAKQAALDSLRPIKKSVSSLTDLEQCLYEFIQPELLSGSNKIICENCSKLKKGSDDSSDESSVESEPRIYRNAQKRYLMYSPPPILTIHLKRFHQVGRALQKLNKRVSFPMKLDVSPYFSKLSPNCDIERRRICYRLYGVVEHMGSLNGGHYVAYVCRSRQTTVVQSDMPLLRFMTSVDKGLPVHAVDTLVQEFQKYQGGTSSGPTLPSNKATECAAEINDDDNEDDDDDGSVRDWFRVSDSSVAAVSMKEVLQCQAYILFYERLM